MSGPIRVRSGSTLRPYVFTIVDDDLVPIDVSAWDGKLKIVEIATGDITRNWTTADLIAGNQMQFNALVTDFPIGKEGAYEMQLWLFDDAGNDGGQRVIEFRAERNLAPRP